MPHAPIIDARHRLRWHQRLFSDATTAVLWGAWLWLWRPVLHAFTWVGASAAPAMSKLVAGNPVPDLSNSVVALAGASGTLLLWNLLPARRAREAAPCTLDDCARHFDLPAEAIASGRDTRVCVVHHDADGRIVRIEARA